MKDVFESDGLVSLSTYENMSSLIENDYNTRIEEMEAKSLYLKSKISERKIENSKRLTELY